MASATYEESVGTTILDQLTCANGGAGECRLRAMVGARDITTLIAGELTSEEVPTGSPGIGFRFRGCNKWEHWNGVEIFYDRDPDEYVARFYRMNLESGVGTVLTTGEWERYYAAELCAMFTRYTGLDTHL